MNFFKITNIKARANKIIANKIVKRKIRSSYQKVAIVSSSGSEWKQNFILKISS